MIPIYVPTVPPSAAAQDLRAKIVQLVQATRSKDSGMTDHDVRMGLQLAKSELCDSQRRLMAVVIAIAVLLALMIGVLAYIKANWSS